MYLTKKGSTFIKKRKLIVWGYIIGAMGIISILMAFTDAQARENIVMAIIFAAAGTLMVLRGTKNNKKALENVNIAREFNNIFCSVSEDSVPIAKIAPALGMSREQTKEKIQELLNDKYLTNIFINNHNDHVVFADRTASATQSAAEPVEVTCSKCGATSTVIPGQSNKCEYCGSPLN